MRLPLLVLSLVTLAGGAFAQSTAPRSVPQICDACGTVQSVRSEKRKGEGGAAGIVGGAVVGGLLGNQIGGGSGRTLATVGGAVAGGYVGNEVQKNVTSKTVWVSRVRMKDGTERTFEHSAQPGWQAGTVVRVDGNKVVRWRAATPATARAG